MELIIFSIIFVINIIAWIMCIGELSQNRWIPVKKRMPKSQEKVYVFCEEKDDVGRHIQFQTIAIWIPYMTVLESDFMAEEFHGEGDYNEIEDEYYTPEGFYEWSSEADINYKLSTPVIAWKPLMRYP